MFNPHHYRNARPNGFPVLEVFDETLDKDELLDKDDKAVASPTLAFVPLQQTLLHGSFAGPLAQLRLTQIFRYTRASYAKPIEALYRFPLPGDAAVQAVRVRFGEVEIVAELQARTQAEQRYTAAKAAGHQAALATREAPDRFTLHLAGLQPDQPVTVETAYVQLARAEEHSPLTAGTPTPQWSLRIPLTTAPRFVREDEQNSRWAQGQPLALLRDPGHRFQLDVTFHGVATVTSTTHELALNTDTGRNSVQVHLAAGEVLPDRDCLLYWSPPQAATQPTLQLITYVDEPLLRDRESDRESNRESGTGDNRERSPAARRIAVQHDTQLAGNSKVTGVAAKRSMLYFLALVTPPRQPAGEEILREVVLLVDHSGSMYGAKWQATDWAVERFLGDLTARDRFALATFHNTTTWFAPTPQPARPDNLDRATAWLREQRTSGGTQLGIALEEALRLERTQPPAATTLARHVLILTDAAVSDGPRILRLADREAAHSDPRRISVLSIDAAPNAFLVHALAERTGGSAHFLTSDPAENDITTALDELLLTWGSPLLSDLHLAINRDEVLFNGQRPPPTQVPAGSDQSVFSLGDLPRGQSRWIVGRLPLRNSDMVPTAEAEAGTADALTLSLSARQAGARQTIASLAAASATSNGMSGTVGLKALFGADRVNALEYLLHADLPLDQLADQLQWLGYDHTQILAAGQTEPAPVSAESQRTQTAEALRALLLQAALDFGLASAETAFIATRREAGNKVATTVAVANALPAGWSAPGVTSSVGGPVHSPMGNAVPRLRQSLAPAFAAPPTALPQPTLADAMEDAAASHEYLLFQGLPSFEQHVALLFESATTAPVTVMTAAGEEESRDLPPAMTISAIRANVAGQANLPTKLRATLAIYVDDLVLPRATVPLVELLRRGTRPLNLQRSQAASLRITLHDPTSDLQASNAVLSVWILATVGT